MNISNIKFSLSASAFVKLIQNVNDFSQLLQKSIQEFRFLATWLRNFFYLYFDFLLYR